MSHFYGSVQGGRGKATRCGHVGTGLRVTAQSFTGSIIVQLAVVNGEDSVAIYVSKGSTTKADYCLYDGPIAKLLDLDSLMTEVARERLLAQAQHHYATE